MANTRHDGYARALEVSKFAKMMITGKGQDEEVTRYRRFEKEALKGQRVRLYNPLTKYALARPRQYWHKVSRIPGVKFTVKGSDQAKLDALNANMANFADNKPLYEWAVETLEFLGSTDPNAWIAYERADVRNAEGAVTAIEVYPYIIPSQNVLDFQQRFGKTLWLLWRETRLQTDKNGRDWQLETLYLYEPGRTTVAREKGEGDVSGENEVEVVFDVMKGEPRTFYVSEYLTGTTEVPAMCAGAYKDETRNLQGFVTWFDPASDVLRELVRDKSNLDMAKTLFAMPQKYEYVKPCDYENEGGRCERGILSGGEHHGERCPSCGGSGRVTNFTTEQETLQLVLPDSPNDILQLSSLYHYEQGNEPMMQWLHSQVEVTEGRVMKAIFSAADVERATGAGTATAKNYEMESVQEKLMPFCLAVQMHCELSYRIGAQYMEIKDFSIDVHIPKDMKMRTLAELIAAFNDAKSGGAGWEVVRDLRRQIWEKQNADDPEQVAKLHAQYEWLPFDDKSGEELAQILASRAPNDPQRVLRENWAEIFGEIEQEYPDFHRYEYAKQKEVVGAKVAEFNARIVRVEEPGFAPIEP